MSSPSETRSPQSGKPHANGDHTPVGSSVGGLPKAYNPSLTEPAVTARWDASGAFHADPMRVVRGEARPYGIFIPPPNVTAALHLGHALNNTLQDTLVRAHRMMGYETLWMPGTDHAGIATQAVVEKRLRKEGKLKGALKDAMKREEFVAHVQAFKDEYEATITAQLKEMGASCDWARRRFTMDDQCAAAVREAFFRLFKDGLIYRGKRLVNWDPALQTAVADDECYDEEIDAAFYYLRYPLVHKYGQETERERLSGDFPPDDAVPVTWSELATRGYPGAEGHPPEQEAWITVATTRPETYLGDTAVAVNPHDPRARALRHLSVELPLVGRIIPIIEDSYVVLPAAMQEDPEEAAKDPKAAYATGFLKVTPAHDPNDWEIGRRHGLAAINVMAPDATISDRHGWSDVGDAHIFVGKKREEARKLAVKEFEARGLLDGAKPYRHSVKHSDRSKAIVEPYLSDQWYVRVTDPSMAASANAALAAEQRGISEGGKSTQSSTEAAGDGSLRFHPARYAKTYQQWHDNIRDWCISRQLWWGHRIPVWTVRLQHGHAPAPFADNHKRLLEMLAEHMARAGCGKGDWQVREIADPPELRHHWFHVCARTTHAAEAIASFKNHAEKQLAPILGVEQDPDVLDTWFSSALWPLSTLGWPDPAKFPGNEGMLQAFNPSSVLCTAREIITLWVSRMVMFNRYFTGNGNGAGQVPFKDVFIHAMIQDGEGRKMSKSLGNGVDPRDIIESHGADAMRFTLVQMTTNTQDVRMPVQKDSRTGRNTSPKFDNGRNFCNKLWNTARFVAEKLAKPAPLGPQPSALGPSSLSLLDRWMLSRLASTVKAVNAALAGYEFSDYAEAMYKVLWWDLCDWYLEGVKPTVESNPAQQAVLAHALETIVRLLHPITPFITEAIWEHIRTIQTRPIAGVTLAPPRKAGLLCTAGWPEIDGSWIDPAAETEFEKVRELVSAIRNARSAKQVAPKRRITLHAPAGGAAISAMKNLPGLVETLCGLERVESGGHPAGATAQARALGEDLVLANIADEAAPVAGDDREELVRKLAALRKSEQTIATRLDNPGYAQRAPARLVEESKQQLANLREEIAALEGRLK